MNHLVKNQIRARKRIIARRKKLLERLRVELNYAPNGYRNGVRKRIELVTSEIKQIKADIWHGTKMQ